MITVPDAPTLTLLIAGVFCTSCAAAPSVSEPVRTAPAAAVETSALVAAAAAVLEVAPQVSLLWPGFWSDSAEFIIYRPGTDVLLVGGVAPYGFSRLEPEGPAWRMAYAFYCEGSLPGLTGNVDHSYIIGGRKVTAVPLQSLVEKTVEDVYHEAFHALQSRSFARAPAAGGLGPLDETAVPDSFIVAPQYIGFAAVEHAILADALTASDSALPPLLEMYAVVRKVRMDGLPASVRQLYINTERKEGSARWIGAAAAAFHEGLAPDSVASSLVPELLSAGSGWAVPYERFRMHAFSSGSALAFLLLRVGVDWRQAVQAGATFHELFAAVPAAQVADIASLQAILERYDFTAHYLRAVEWEAAVTDPQTVFRESGRIALTVEFTEIAERDAEFRATGRGIPVQLDDGRINIFQGASSFTVDYEGISMYAEHTPYMLDFHSSPTVRVTFRLQDLPAGAVPGEHPGGAHLTMPGFSVRTARPLDIIAQATDSVLIRIR